MKIKLKKGALHKEVGIPKGQKIPVTLLHGLAHHAPDEKTRKRATFALNARQWKHK